MAKTILVTVADDRFGRKNSAYGITQDKIVNIFNNNPQFGISTMLMWKWDDIENTDFYKENKVLLDNKDAARNGRVYKPLIILEGLNQIKDGDFLIYSDCSPEVWNLDEDFSILPSTYNLSVIQNLCEANNDILTSFVKWDIRNIPKDGLGMHTHKYFTLDSCIDKMGLRKYENSYIHASGMFCIRKTKETMIFVRDWLFWNKLDVCCSLGDSSIENDTSYWQKELEYKLGHRHDQSISGLLINKRGGKLVDIVYNSLNPYNPLNFCRTDTHYKFIDSNSKPPRDVLDFKEEYIIKGDIVINDKGIELTVFSLRHEGDKEIFRVGQLQASTYETTREFIKLKKKEL